MTTISTWPAQAETWLDERGKGAWIAAMVVGFILFWPIGLALLAYMIWSKRMFNGCTRRDTAHHYRKNHRFRSSGNAAFDAYKADMLRRLEDEQKAFEDFLQRLREAKDKAEFDQFMNDQARRARETRDSDGGDGGDETPPPVAA
jgi:predicted CopG family antitoxin